MAVFTIPDWQQLRVLAASKVYKLSALFPLIGYLILLYPGLADLISHPTSHCFLFPLITPKPRLYILYYALFFVGLSALLMLRIPQMFLVYRTSDEYADARLQDSPSRKSSWPAPGFEDTKLGVLMEPEVDHGEAEVYTRVQA